MARRPIRITISLTTAEWDKITYLAALEDAPMATVAQGLVTSYMANTFTPGSMFEQAFDRWQKQRKPVAPKKEETPHGAETDNTPF
jgi:hypothetical protein